MPSIICQLHFQPPAAPQGDQGIRLYATAERQALNKTNNIRTLTGKRERERNNANYLLSLRKARQSEL
jgi:hypothetical protein